MRDELAIYEFKTHFVSLVIGVCAIKRIGDGVRLSF